jgi:hypothetical protein
MEATKRMKKAMKIGKGFVELAKEAAIEFEKGYEARPVAERIRIEDIDMDEESELKKTIMFLMTATQAPILTLLTLLALPLMTLDWMANPGFSPVHSRCQRQRNRGPEITDSATASLRNYGKIRKKKEESQLLFRHDQNTVQKRDGVHLFELLIHR